MKSLFLAATLALVGTSAMATDLSSVGDNSVEVGVDYAYARVHRAPVNESAQSFDGDLQLNFGKVGTFFAEGGDVRTRVAGDVYNDSVFGGGYANALKFGPALKLVGAVSYTNINTYTPVQSVDGRLELIAKVNKPVSLYVGGSRDHSWLSDDSRKDQFNQTTAGAGTYVKICNVTTKVGYEHAFHNTYTDVGPLGSTNGVVASVNWAF